MHHPFNSARTLAADGWLVTFGIPPSAPETGFGYIEAGASVGQGFKVARFVEKPSREKAESCLAAGNFTWNIGHVLFYGGGDARRVARACTGIAGSGRRDAGHHGFRQISASAGGRLV